MRGLQEPQLYIDEEQEEESGPPGAEEVLPCVPAPHGPQGSEVGRRQKAKKPFATAYGLLQAAYWFSAKAEG
jgi:hypothetical protein